MSLQIGNTTAVDAAASASVDDLTAFSVLQWVYVTSVPTSDTKRLWRKGDKDLGTPSGGTDALARKLRGSVPRATTSSDFVTTDSSLSLNTWTFIAATYDESDGYRAFMGTLTAMATEMSYTSRNVGSGATNADTASSFWVVGNQSAHNDGLPAHHAKFMLVKERLTLGQIQRYQFDFAAATSKGIYYELGFNGTGTQPDLSGNGISGTPFGSVTQTAHVPIARPFRMRNAWRGNYTAAAGGQPTMRRFGGTPGMTPGSQLFGRGW